MKYYIMKLWQTGNVGSCNIAKIDANPKDGYQTHELAEKALEKLREEGNFEARYYNLTILPIWPACR